MVRTTADDDFDRQVLEDICTYGWHVVGIPADDTGPGYAFSVGIYETLNFPEVCIFGLPDVRMMMSLVNDIGTKVRSGERMQDWFACDELLEGYNCIFRNVDRGHYSDYFGYANWYHEGHDFPVLQCFWPDRTGRFPWETECAKAVREAQPILATKSDWPFADAKNTCVITTRQILSDGLPLLLVAHDEDGDWQFLCGSTNEADDGCVAALGCMVDLHPAVAELADLPLGWIAERESPNLPWVRSRNV